MKPIAEKHWPKVIEYCGNDVLSNRGKYLKIIDKADWTARKILAELAGGTRT